MLPNKNLSLTNKSLLIVLVALVFLIGVFFRIEYGARFRGNLFTVESALRFNYARMVAQGKQIPAVDYNAQYPEGFSVRARNPVFMETVIGNLYRFLNCSVPFDDFVRIFLPFWASLAIFAVYLITREIADNNIVSLTASLLYAVSLSAVSRGCGWEFLHETFALPLIFFHIYFFLKSLRRRAVYYSLISGVFLFFALASWEVSQFYASLYVLFAALNFIFKNKEPRLFVSFTILSAFLILSGLALPFLRNGLFLCSYTMIIVYALLIARVLERYASCLGARPIFVFFAVMVLLLAFLPPSPRYSHTYNLLFYKSAFLGRKPLNPALLPFEVRLVWVPPFISPSFFEVIYCFFPWLFLAAVPAAAGVGKMLKGKTAPGQLFIIYSAAAFFFFYLLVKRLYVFLVFFLVILIACLLLKIMRWRPKYAFTGLAIIFLCVIAEAGKTLTYGKENIFAKAMNSIGIRERKAAGFKVFSLTDVNRSLIDWIKNNTGAGDVILAHYLLSPPLYVYTGRAVNLTSVMESVSLREKVEEFSTALFDPEEKLYNLCRRYKTNYVVYTADTVLDDSAYSLRYLANALSLHEGMAAYKMHFYPEALKHFRLVYENGYYRVYQVTDGEGGGAPVIAGNNHPLVYDCRLFAKTGSLARFRQYIDSVYRLYIQGEQYLAAGKYQPAAQAYHQALAKVPDFPYPYMGLGILSEEQGFWLQAVSYYNKYISLQPQGVFAPVARARREKIRKEYFLKIDNRK